MIHNHSNNNSNSGVLLLGTMDSGEANPSLRACGKPPIEMVLVGLFVGGAVWGRAVRSIPL